MTHLSHRAALERYLAAYNAFDIDAMLRELHPEVTFINQSGAEITHQTFGIAAFRAQAEQAAALFSERTQRIVRYLDTQVADAPEITVEIHYSAVLAQDLPNGMKAGEAITLSGWSDLRFQDGKIIGITDRS